MLIKGIIDEDFVNYRVPSMTINTNTCTFKCNKECGVDCCQNSDLARAKSIDVNTHQIVKRYMQNRITKAVCFAGLEPFDQFDDLMEFVEILRDEFKCDDTVVIYTGYYENEIQEYIKALKPLKNIVVKFGRFIPDQEGHYDEVLGIKLASPNQYAKEI